MAVLDYKAFIDDSGNSPSDPWLVLGAWVGSVPEWNSFTEDWNTTLTFDPSIDYFKLNEAIALKGCFAGFTAGEADEKCRQLLDVIVRHDIHGAVSIVSPAVHREVIQDGMPRKKNGRLDHKFKNAFYLSFQDILQSIFKIHAEEGFEGKVDVVIDGKKGSGPTSKSIRVYESVKEQLKKENHLYYPIMGTVIPGDDKDIKPLQAADFLAGQVRIAKTFNYKTPAFRMMYREKRIFYNEMTAEYLKRQFVDRANALDHA